MATACASCEFVYGPGHVAAPCQHQLVPAEPSTAVDALLAEASREVGAALGRRGG